MSPFLAPRSPAVHLGAVYLPSSLVPFGLGRIPGANFVVDYEDRQGARITATYTRVRSALPLSHFAGLVRDGWPGVSVLVALDTLQFDAPSLADLERELSLRLAGAPGVLTLVGEPMPFIVRTPLDQGGFMTARVRLRIQLNQPSRVALSAL